MCPLAAWVQRVQQYVKTKMRLRLQIGIGAVLHCGWGRRTVRAGASHAQASLSKMGRDRRAIGVLTAHCLRRFRASDAEHLATDLSVSSVDRRPRWVVRI